MWPTCIPPICPLHQSLSLGNHIRNASQNSWNCEGITRTNRCSHGIHIQKQVLLLFPNGTLILTPSSGQEIIDVWLYSSLCHYSACCLIGPQEYVDTRVNPSCLHFSRGSIKRILFIFPMVTLCSVYSVVCLVRHKNDLCQRFCFETQAFLQSLLASSEVVTFWTLLSGLAVRIRG